MLTVLIPAKNEEGAITGTIQRIQQVLSEAGLDGFEVLVINDGSTDRTGPLAEAAGARVINHPHNAGYGRSLKHGIRAARHDTICITDADLTYPAEAIPGLLKEYQRGNDMVVGQRTGSHYRESALKAPLRRVLQWLVEYAAGRKVPDANSGLRIFSQKTILEHLPHLCDTFSFTTSMTIAYMLTGKFVTYVPIEYHARVGRTHVKLLKDSLRTLLYICQSVMYYSPLKIFNLFVVACILASFVAVAFGMLTGIRAGYLLGLGGLLVALFMFGLGLLADVLRQILLK
ncbi:MAG: glycosyltransferase family 2 protein [Phycisphaeraceae bacterium]|nr:glycosyltransferase family 2 protein [Phycisphaeraceae bacterium]